MVADLLRCSNPYCVGLHGCQFENRGTKNQQCGKIKHCLAHQRALCI